MNKLKSILIASFLITLMSNIAAKSLFSGPLVVDDAYILRNGNIISGNYKGTLTQPAITISTSQPVTITDTTVTGPGDLISGSSVNLTVTNTNGIATNPNILNTQKGKFINITHAMNLIVDHCTIQGTRFGVYVNSFTGNKTTQTIKITNNNVINIDGRMSDGNGGYIQSGNYNAHAFQFNQVQGVSQLEIAWNQVINQPYNSQCSDLINIYSSSGTPTSHLLIHDNYLQGAYAGNPGVDRYTGGGSITDGKAADTTTTATAYVDMYNNQMVSTSNYGYSIASGHDNTVYNNRVVSAGVLSTGQPIGMYFANALENYNDYQQPSTVFYNNYVHDNYAGLIRTSSAGVLMRSDWYLPGQASGSGSNSHFLPNEVGSPSLADEISEFQIWQKKLTAANMTIGSNISNTLGLR